MNTTQDVADGYRRSFAPDDTACEATVHAVAEAIGRDALDLPPLGQTIDADGLDRLVSGAPETGPISVRFEYAGCIVTVTSRDVSVIER
jgi:hypothetical protein